jgi:hypothetical protein
MNTHYEVNTKLKIKIMIVLIIVVICSIVSASLYISEGNIVKKSITDYLPYSQDSSLLFSIDDVKINTINEDGYIEILGWACEEGSDIVRYNCHVALEDVLRDIVYILPTMMIQREDVGAYFKNSGYNDSGFYSKAKTAQMQLDESRLEFVIIYENNDSKIYYHTGVYIENGEMVD